MRRTINTAFCASVLISLLTNMYGCSAEENPMITRAKQHVAADLKDPESVQYRGISVFSEKVVCGEYNAKNSYGGYVGFKKFIDSSGEDNYIHEADANYLDTTTLCSNSPGKFLIYDRRQLKRYIESPTVFCKEGRRKDMCDYVDELVSKFMKKYPAEALSPI